MLCERDNRQVTIMPDRSCAGSAGMRNHSNIEMIHQRRLLGHDSYGINEPLDDRD